MADNLSVSIGADTSKLRGEIKLVEAQLKQLDRQITAALKSGDTARAGELTQQFGKMQTTLVGLNKTAADTGVIVSRSLNNIAGASGKVTRGFEDIARSGQGFRRLVGQFSSMGRGLESIGSIVGGLAGGFAGAFAGVAVVQAITWLLSNLDNVSKRLSELQKQAREAGVAPVALQAAGRQAMQAGQDAEVGAKGFASFATAVETAKAAMPKENTGGVDVFRGGDAKDAANQYSGLVQVFRGGQPAILDFSNALKLLQVNLKNIKTPQDQVTAYEKAIKRALELGKQFPQEMNRVSQSLFGMPLETLRQITSNGESLDALIKKLMASQAGATNQALDDNTKLIQAKNNLALAFQDATAGYQKWLIGFQTSNNQMLADFISTTLPAWGQGISDFFANLLPNLQAEIAAAWKSTNGLILGAIGTTYDEAFKAILAAAQNFFQSIIDGAARALAALNPFGGATPATNPAVAAPMASGGMVYGPGTATSDSVLARLSRGEYVMRARAVDHWGPRFMASLNSLRSPSGFAGGGLVMPRHALPHFADGGLVAAGAGGTPVHLHLGGHSFALSGAGGVVDALVTEAHRHKIRSAGTKPSWYGGRPGH